MTESGSGHAVDKRVLAALAEVTRTVQLQRRHLIFWLLIGLFVVGIGWLIHGGSALFASAPEIDEESGSGATVQLAITVQPNGLTVINGRSTHKILRPLGAFDELKYKILDRPGFFIDQLTARVTFPQPLPAATKIQAFAVHGIDTATQQQLDDRTVEYTATGIGPDAVYTINAEIPPGTIHWPWYRRLGGWLTNLPLGAWLTVSALLPLSAGLVLVIMFWPLLADYLTPLPILSEPDNGQPPAWPANLTPAVVGVLVHGRVSAREIAATLLDLAQRGYLTIFNKGNGTFSFAKSQPWQSLASFELQLLTQLFKSTRYKATEHDIELSVGQNLFSPAVAQVYLAIYDVATEAGYFRHNPGAVHRRYRLIGLMLFFIGLLAFATAFVLELQPNYSLILLAGMMTMALVIILAADSVPLLTPAGRTARRQWLAWRRYLTNPDPVGYVEGSQSYYERLLPYAVVLRAEPAWTNRFRQYPFRPPSWYDSVEPSRAIEDVSQGLYGVVGTIGQLFSAVKEPTIS